MAEIDSVGPLASPPPPPTSKYVSIASEVFGSPGSSGKKRRSKNKTGNQSTSPVKQEQPISAMELSVDSSTSIEPSDSQASADVQVPANETTPQQKRILPKSSTDERWKRWPEDRRSKLERFRESADFTIELAKEELLPVVLNSPPTTPERVTLLKSPYSSKTASSARRFSTSPTKTPIRPSSASRTSVQPSPGVASTVSSSRSSRLYDSALEIREMRDRERQTMEEHERRQREVRTSPRTRDLAVGHWVKKITKAFEKCEDYHEQNRSVTFNSCLECFVHLGFISAPTTPALVGEREPETLLKQFKHQLGVSDGGDRISLDLVLEIAAVALKEDSVSSSDLVVSRFREFFKCPSAKAVVVSPQKETPQRVMPLSEFLSRIQSEQQRSEMYFQELLKQEAKKFEEECPFSPQRSAAPPSARAAADGDGETETVPCHLRLYREAEERKRKTEEQVKALSRRIEEQIQKECTFSPSITDSSKSFTLPPEDFYDRRPVVEHLLRQEIARVRKQDEQERFDALGRVNASPPVRNGKRTVPARLFPKKLLIPITKEQEIAVEVILKDDEKVAIHVNARDDASAVAREFAVTFQLETARETMLKTALDEAITTLRMNNIHLSPMKAPMEEEEEEEGDCVSREDDEKKEDGSSLKGRRYFFDENAKRWYVHDFASGVSEWI